MQPPRKRLRVWSQAKTAETQAKTAETQAKAAEAQAKAADAEAPRTQVKTRETQGKRPKAQAHAADPDPDHDNTDAPGGEDPTPAKMNLATWPRFLPFHTCAASSQLLPPSELQAKYGLLGSVGHGRFGIVYAARNVATGVLVAIKCSEDPASVAEP